LATRRSRRAPRPAPAQVRRQYAPRPLRFAAELEALLAREFQALASIALRELEPLLIHQLGARKDAASLSDLWRRLRSTLRPEAILRRLFQQVNADVTASLERRLPELPLASVVSNGAQLREAWVARNADLIKVEPRLQRAIEEVLSAPLERGVRVEEIRKQLQERFGIEERRAQLIARDQTLKLAGQLQEERQTQAGIKRYVWTTSDDERVREDHAALDGTIQEWANPPVVDKRTGRRGHPGDDFQCRCSADPILDEPEEEA
jgi:SPP1 gp7 family putative phage head morphogenesis protein